MPRVKGFKLTDEQKQKMREGRIAAKQAKKEIEIPKVRPVLVIRGDEETGFDFWPLIRKTLRPLHCYLLCKKIEKDIVDPKIWNNVGIVRNILANYFELQEMEDKPPKKVRKARPPLSEDRKKELRLTLEKARAVRAERKKNEGIP